MPYWIEGWVEVNENPSDDGWPWLGVIRLSPLIPWADEDSDTLFGLSKGSRGQDSLAANRGIPADASDEVRREMQVIAAHEAKHGKGECGGYTNATWEELRTYRLVESAEDSPWKIIFDIVRQLEQRYQPKGIRFIVWYNW